MPWLYALFGSLMLSATVVMSPVISAGALLKITRFISGWYG